MGVLRVYLILIALAIPITLFGADLTLKVGEEHTFSLEGAVPGGTLSCYWEIDGEPQEETISSIKRSWDEEGYYYISARYEVNGCISPMSTIEVEVIEQEQLPKIIPYKFFTPDGDGVNELWWIENIEYYPNSKIEIYDRYSRRLVFFTGNEFINLKGWDGNYNGHPMPSDDYWYYIRDIIPNKPCSGHFILKRGKK